MGALTASVIAIAGIALGWITIEIACKPCLEQGRQAIDRSLNPDYDPDDHHHVGPTSNIHAPLNPPTNPDDDDDPAASSTVVKII